MTTGDSQDIVARLKTEIPNGWLGGDTPFQDGVLSGIADGDANIYALAQYAKLQTRIQTATGGWLDLIALDFYGTTLPRGAGENDSSYRTRIRAGLFAKANTRAAIAAALLALTGSEPTIIEPWNPNDTNVWGGRAGTGVGYWGMPASSPYALRWTNSSLAAQFFVFCELPINASLGSAKLPAWRARAFWSTYSFAWLPLGQEGKYAEQEVFQLIARLKVCGVKAYVQFIAAPPPKAVHRWDEPGLTWDQPGIKWDN